MGICSRRRETRNTFSLPRWSEKLLDDRAGGVGTVRAHHAISLCVRRSVLLRRTRATSPKRSRAARRRRVGAVAAASPPRPVRGTAAARPRNRRDEYDPRVDDGAGLSAALADTKSQTSNEMDGSKMGNSAMNSTTKGHSAGVLVERMGLEASAPGGTRGRRAAPPRRRGDASARVATGRPRRPPCST